MYSLTFRLGRHFPPPRKAKSGYSHVRLPEEDIRRKAGRQSHMEQTNRIKRAALQAKYTHMRQLFLDGLDRIDIPHNVPEGAYFIMLDISEFGYESDLEYCEKASV